MTGERLDNGLRLLWCEEDTETVTLLVVVGLGSHDEPEAWPGLAHLLEHLVFAGHEGDPDGLEFLYWMHRHGGRYNASTRPECTEYMLQVPAAVLLPTLQRWLPMLWHPQCAPHQVARERHILEAEFRTRLADPRLHQQDLMATWLSPSHPLSRFSAGHASSLAGPPERLAQALRHLHARGYGAGNVRLALQGPWSRLPQAAVRQLLSRWPSGAALQRRPVPMPQAWPPDLHWWGPQSDTHCLLRAVLPSLPPACRRAWPAWRRWALESGPEGLLGRLQRQGLALQASLEALSLSGEQWWLRLELDGPGQGLRARQVLRQWLQDSACEEVAIRALARGDLPGDPDGWPGPPDPAFAALRYRLRNLDGSMGAATVHDWVRLGRRLARAHWWLLDRGPGERPGLARSRHVGTRYRRVTEAAAGSSDEAMWWSPRPGLPPTHPAASVPPNPQGADRHTAVQLEWRVPRGQAELLSGIGFRARWLAVRREEQWRWQQQGEQAVLELKAACPEDLLDCVRTLLDPDPALRHQSDPWIWQQQRRLAQLPPGPRLLQSLQTLAGQRQDAPAMLQVTLQAATDWDIPWRTRAMQGLALLRTAQPAVGAAVCTPLRREAEEHAAQAGIGAAGTLPSVWSGQARQRAMAIACADATAAGEGAAALTRKLVQRVMPESVACEAPGHAALLWMAVSGGPGLAGDLARLLAAPLYQHLRLEQQLGYWVEGCARAGPAGKAGLVFWVQSPHRVGPDLLACLLGAAGRIPYWLERLSLSGWRSTPLSGRGRDGADPQAARQWAACLHGAELWSACSVPAEHAREDWIGTDSGVSHW